MNEILGKIDNWAVLMVGGLGVRLWPLTGDCPKPLLKVGNKPILETTIRLLADCGFHRFFLAVNYQSEKIIKVLGDGSGLGVGIEYIKEEKKLGTAGALSLLPDTPTCPVLVMNGDILTRADFNKLLSFHQNSGAAATVCIRKATLRMPFGVVAFKGSHLLEITEKPEQIYYVNAGIYVLEPDVLSIIPYNRYYDMTTLLKDLVKRRLPVAVWPFHDYWIDIGNKESLDKASAEYFDFF